MFNYLYQFVIGLGGQYFLQSEKKKMDIVNLLPQEMTHEIFSYLNAYELKRCFRVSKTWKVLASHEALWNALPPKIAFGKKQWAKYFGDIGKEPSLPKDIHKILKSPCPFFPKKKVEETHLLVLIPETIDGKPLNFITLRELVKAKSGLYAQHPIINFFGLRFFKNMAINRLLNLTGCL